MLEYPFRFGSVPQKEHTGMVHIPRGSFLMRGDNDQACSGYRVATRMKTSANTGLSHTGFRCVKDLGKVNID